MEKDFLVREKYKIIGSPNEAVFYNGKGILCLHKNWIEIKYGEDMLVNVNCYDCGDSYFLNDIKSISGFCWYGYSPKEFYEIQKETREQYKKYPFRKIERFKGHYNIDLDQLKYYKYE